MEDDVDFEGTRAKMHVTLVELPPILQIQLQVSLDVKPVDVLRLISLLSARSI